MKTLVKLIILSVFIVLTSCVKSNSNQEKELNILDSLREDSIAKRAIEKKDSIAKFKAEMAANPYSDTLFIDWYQF